VVLEIHTNHRELEQQQRMQQIRLVKEKERISRMTARIALEQKNKDCLFLNKEKEEEIKIKRYLNEKQI